MAESKPYQDPKTKEELKIHVEHHKATDISFKESSSYQHAIRYFIFPQSESNLQTLKFKSGAFSTIRSRYRKFAMFCPTLKNETELDQPCKEFASLFRQAAILANTNSGQAADVHIQISVGRQYVLTNSPVLLLNKELSVRDFGKESISDGHQMFAFNYYQRIRVNNKKLIAFLEKSNFVNCSKNSKYQVNMIAGATGKHKILSFTEDLTIKKVKFEFLNWFNATICNGFDEMTGVKRVDTSLKLFSKKVNIEHDLNPEICPLKKDKEGHIYVKADFEDKVESVFLEETLWYEHKDSEDEKGIWKGVRVKITSCTEYWSRNGTTESSLKYNSCNRPVPCLVFPRFSGFEQSEEEFTERLWNMMTILADVVEPEPDRHYSVPTIDVGEL